LERANASNGRPRRAERVSLCATLFNEADSVAAWLESIFAQSLPPDEIVLCDAGSTDGTIEHLEAIVAERPELRLIVETGASIPEGRNVAIGAATGPLIAVTDAGTILDRDWLERLLEPLEADPELAVSAGFYRPAGRNAFERLLATVITPRRRDIAADGFPPSSRSVAFRKEWWERVGGYPAWLRACEDLVFDFRLRDLGARFAFAPEAIVSWYPRPTLRDFYAQYRHYARGDGHGHLFFGRHAIRYAAYAFGLALAVRSRRSRLARILLALGVFLHMRKFLWRVWDEKPFEGPLGRATAYAVTPVIVVVGDVAKMVGFPQGLWERRRAGGPEGLQVARFESHRRTTGRGRAQVIEGADQRSP
jgi:cellulose synthase/poly-beta-1,6-N-acetylglucosamine synthase-like glycosyltransferase